MSLTKGIEPLSTREVYLRALTRCQMNLKQLEDQRFWTGLHQRQWNTIHLDFLALYAYCLEKGYLF